VAVSLPEIVKSTNAFSVQYQGGCTAVLKDSNPKDLFLRYTVTCSKPESDPSGHDVLVHFDLSKLAETQLARDLDVRVSCSCEAFLYWGAQWNLHQRDGLEGVPRPKLQAPTERLDLRGHFVVCKHVYVVFKRILPSVQHNIVKILREREVKERKEKGAPEVPTRLQQEQEETKKRQEILKIKDKEVQKKMLDALRKEEEEKLEEEQKTPAWMRLPEKYKEVEVEREKPATLIEEIEEQEPKPPAHMPEMEQNALRDLYKEDIANRREKHQEVEEEGSLHVHEGLPYKTDRELLEEKKKKKAPGEMKEFLNKRK